MALSRDDRKKNFNGLLKTVFEKHKSLFTALGIRHVLIDTHNPKTMIKLLSTILDLTEDQITAYLLEKLPNNTSEHDAFKSIILSLQKDLSAFQFAIITIIQKYLFERMSLFLPTATWDAKLIAISKLLIALENAFGENDDNLFQVYKTIYTRDKIALGIDPNRPIPGDTRSSFFYNSIDDINKQLDSGKLVGNSSTSFISQELHRQQSTMQQEIFRAKVVARAYRNESNVQLTELTNLEEVLKLAEQQVAAEMDAPDSTPCSATNSRTTSSVTNLHRVG